MYFQFHFGKKSYTDKAYSYFVENLGEYVLNFLTLPLNVSLEYIKVLRSSKRTDWAGLATSNT